MKIDIVRTSPYSNPYIRVAKRAAITLVALGAIAGLSYLGLTHGRSPYMVGGFAGVGVVLLVLSLYASREEATQDKLKYYTHLQNSLYSYKGEDYELFEGALYKRLPNDTYELEGACFKKEKDRMCPLVRVYGEEYVMSTDHSLVENGERFRLTHSNLLASTTTGRHYGPDGKIFVRGEKTLLKRVIDWEGKTYDWIAGDRLRLDERRYVLLENQLCEMDDEDFISIDMGNGDLVRRIYSYGRLFKHEAGNTFTCEGRAFLRLGHSGAWGEFVPLSIGTEKERETFEDLGWASEGSKYKYIEDKLYRYESWDRWKAVDGASRDYILSKEGTFYPEKLETKAERKKWKDHQFEGQCGHYAYFSGELRANVSGFMTGGNVFILTEKGYKEAEYQFADVYKVDNFVVSANEDCVRPIDGRSPDGFLSIEPLPEDPMSMKRDKLYDVVIVAGPNKPNNCIAAYSLEHERWLYVPESSLFNKKLITSCPVADNRRDNRRWLTHEGEWHTPPLYLP